MYRWVPILGGPLSRYPADGSTSEA